MSSALKAPRWNSAAMIRPGMVRNATANGAERAREKPAARFCAAWAPATSPAAIRRLISGSSTVPAAMAMTPKGSW